MLKNLDLVEDIINVTKTGSILYDRIFNPDSVKPEQLLIFNLLCGIDEIIYKIKDKIQDN